MAFPYGRSPVMWSVPMSPLNVSQRGLSLGCVGRVSPISKTDSSCLLVGTLSEASQPYKILHKYMWHSLMYKAKNFWMNSFMSWYQISNIHCNIFTWKQKKSLSFFALIITLWLVCTWTFCNWKLLLKSIFM